MKTKYYSLVSLGLAITVLLVTLVSLPADKTAAQRPDVLENTEATPDSIGVGYTVEEPMEPTDIGYRTEDPGPFLQWPLPASVPRTSISVIPDSPWTEYFLGISDCPQYPPMIDDYWWDGVLYSGQFDTYALPGTTKDRVRFLNTDNTGVLHNFFACYRATPSWGLPDHAGTDISASNGTSVLAAATATEVYVVIDGAGDYRIRLRHPNVNGSGQTWYTFYVHLSASTYPLGTTTAVVPAGQKIGEVGQGHLHFQAAIGGSYANSEARNIWGIDEAPWGGCLWVDSSLCASLDQTPPTTTLSLSGTLGENDWFISDVQATLSADEPVDWTKYRIDYDEWLVYDAAFAMACDGIHPLQYHSTDLFRNEEVIRTATIKIGQTASPPDDPFSSRWKAWSPSSSVFSLDKCTPLHIGDVNGDALDDLVCPYDYGESTTKTLVQLSSGSDFSRWTEWSPQAVGTFDVNHCKPLHIGDINGDGFDDLVCPYDYGESTTKTLVQLSSGSDLSRWTEWSPIAEGTFAVDHCKPLHIGDVNGDGSDDLVCPYDYGESTTKTFVQLSSGSGFSEWTAWSPRAEGTFAVDHCKPLYIGDVNGDALDDLVCPYDYGESTTKTFVQLSSGSDFSAWTAWSPQAVGTFDVNHCKPLHIGDVNGDGSYDLVCPYDYGNCRTKTLVQLSSGSDFSGWTAWSSDSYSLDVGNCKSLEISDANGDGRDDLVCPYDYYSNTTMTFVQLSTGTAYGDWIAWSPRNEGGFGLDNCKFLQVGSIEGDRHSDVICPYDYGDSTTQTWVQISSRFSVYLPLVVRP